MKRSKKRNNLTLLFFTGYVFLLISLIAGVMFIDSPIKSESISTALVDSTFKEAIESYETKQEEKKKVQSEPRWKPSNELVMTAVSIGAVLDIIIIVIWAKYQNRTQQASTSSKERKWLYSKLFWNIVALGVIQPKENKLVINWINMIAVTIFIHLLLYYILKDI
ncbi:hypothetical protein [Bacillus tuaregi]|uniref:hypothetical protein n=1 Tax=Bacillus tuaregi TaxID=1816695 RepID=UPI0008F843AC|nr:hypothetical protein [Bacillus tuaregi]